MYDSHQRFCSVWDIHKELQNLTRKDTLRPRDRKKGPRWLLRRTKMLPKSSYMLTRILRLSRLDYRAIWMDMTEEHRQVVSALKDAASATATKGYNCLFNKALKKMVTFVDHFATKVAPLSGSADDREFEILMENFGTVVETVSIFYDFFGCDARSKTLKDERDGGRMTFFCFEKNERPTPLKPSESQQIYNARFPENPISEIVSRAAYVPRPTYDQETTSPPTPSNQDEFSVDAPHVAHDREVTYDEEVASSPRYEDFLVGFNTSDSMELFDWDGYPSGSGSDSSFSPS